MHWKTICARMSEHPQSLNHSWIKLCLKRCKLIGRRGNPIGRRGNPKSQNHVLVRVLSNNKGKLTLCDVDHGMNRRRKGLIAVRRFQKAPQTAAAGRLSTGVYVVRAGLGRLLGGVWTRGRSWREACLSGSLGKSDTKGWMFGHRCVALQSGQTVMTWWFVGGCARFDRAHRVVGLLCCVQHHGNSENRRLGRINERKDLWKQNGVKSPQADPLQKAKKNALVFKNKKVEGQKEEQGRHKGNEKSMCSRNRKTAGAPASAGSRTSNRQLKRLILAPVFLLATVNIPLAFSAWRSDIFLHWCPGLLSERIVVLRLALTTFERTSMQSVRQMCD